MQQWRSQKYTAYLVLQLDWEVDVLLQAGGTSECGSCLLLDNISTLQV